jgi:hypothetical protein
MIQRAVPAIGHRQSSILRDGFGLPFRMATAQAATLSSFSFAPVPARPISSTASMVRVSTAAPASSSAARAHLADRRLQLVNAQALETDRQIKASARSTEVGRQLMELPVLAPSWRAPSSLRLRILVRSIVGGTWPPGSDIGAETELERLTSPGTAFGSPAFRLIDDRPEPASEGVAGPPAINGAMALGW